MLVDKNKKFIKVLTVIGVVLASGGLILLIFLEIKFLNLPSSELASFSETFHLPSSVISYLTPKTLISQSLPTPTPPPAGGSTATAAVSPYHGKFTGVLADDIKLVFADPSYKDIVSLIDDSAKQTDLNLIYADYKKAFNLMKTAYLNHQNNLDMRTMMIELKITASTLPQFSETDMEMPK